MKIEIPVNCPCCSYTLEMINDQLFCRNTACDAQLTKKVEHFCKTLGIKGMGAKTIDKLGLADITEIFYLDEDQVSSALSSKVLATKLINEIEKAKQVDLATIITSFSIPLVGNTASKKICAAINNIDEITYDKCREAGLGDKVSQNLVSWLESEFLEVREFLPFSFTSVKVQLQSGGKSVCITGKLSSYKTKSEAYKALEEAGFKVAETVTKSTDYVVDEDNKGSSKRKKADELGITIIQNLNTFLKEKTND